MPILLALNGQDAHSTCTQRARCPFYTIKIIPHLYNTKIPPISPSPHLPISPHIPPSPSPDSRLKPLVIVT
ncbi:hypothetical protein [Moorena bouillonii]|uniref:hypothetical protein n=1 Tax=Moorena bouillonii TaxID=207920 RepID=UPI00117F7207|nr:hypothetical protein [Moorena bouillonii]